MTNNTIEKKENQFNFPWFMESKTKINYVQYPNEKYSGVNMVKENASNSDNIKVWLSVELEWFQTKCPNFEIPIKNWDKWIKILRKINSFWELKDVAERMRHEIELENLLEARDKQNFELEYTLAEKENRFVKMGLLAKNTHQLESLGWAETDVFLVHENKQIKINKTTLEVEHI